MLIRMFSFNTLQHSISYAASGLSALCGNGFIPARYCRLFIKVSGTSLQISSICFKGHINIQYIDFPITRNVAGFVEKIQLMAGMSLNALTELVCQCAVQEEIMPRDIIAGSGVFPLMCKAYVIQT